MILTEEKLVSKIMDFVCYEKNYFYVLAKVYNVGILNYFIWIDGLTGSSKKMVQSQF